MIQTVADQEGVVESISAQSTAPKRGRGRPRISYYERFYARQYYYIEVEVVRAETLLTTGKLRPISETCRLIEKRGGVAWISQYAPSTPKSAKDRRYEVEILNKKLRFHPNENSKMNLHRLVQDADTIETRYHEAARFAESDPTIKFAWDNMVRDRVGLPRLPTERPRLSIVVPGALVRSYCWKVTVACTEGVIRVTDINVFQSNQRFLPID